MNPDLSGQTLHVGVWGHDLLMLAGRAGAGLTPVLTSDSMILSLSASVSPCFILILFLSRHFMAYLKQNAGGHKHVRLGSAPPAAAALHLPRVGLPAAVHLPEAAPADDPVDAEVVHGQLGGGGDRSGLNARIRL